MGDVLIRKFRDRDEEAMRGFGSEGSSGSDKQYERLTGLTPEESKFLNQPLYDERGKPRP